MSHSPGRTPPVCPLRRRSTPRLAAMATECWAEPPRRVPLVVGALDEEVPVVLPGEADASEGLERVTAHQALAVVAGGLGHGDGGGPGGSVLVDGGDGEIAEGAGTLQGEEHVAHLVLDGLEGAYGHSELLAVLDVVENHAEERIGGADGLEREPDGRLVQRTGDAERGGRAAGLSEGAVVGDEDAVERGGVEGSARIERVHGGEAGLDRGDDEHTDAFSDAGDDGDLAHPGVGQEAELRAVEDPSTLGALGDHGHVVQGPCPAGGRPSPRIR